MRTFILAAIAASVASAMDYTNMKTIIDQAALVSTTDPVIDYGKLTVKTGWARNGAGSDATLDMMLMLEAANTDPATDYMVNAKAVWSMVISKDETIATSEMQRFTFRDGEKVLLTMAYGVVQKNEKDIIDPAAENLVDTFNAFLDVTTLVNSDKSTNPIGFWSIDTSDISTYSNELWQLGLTRNTDTSGVAEITVGAVKPGFICYALDGVEVYKSTVKLEWLGEPIDTEDDETDNTETPDETPTDGDDTTEKDTSKTDGATSVATYGTAILAAVASLMF